MKRRITALFAATLMALSMMAGPAMAFDGEKQREVGSVIAWTSDGGEFCDDFNVLTIYEGVTPANPSGRFTETNDVRRTIYRIKCDGVQYTAVLNADDDIIGGNWPTS